jgi:hypothetical protein
MFVRTGERHPFPNGDATHPDNQFAFKVTPVPVRDWAEAALKEAQDAYFSKWPEERKRASSLLWQIEKVGGYEDPNVRTAVGWTPADATADAIEAMRRMRGIL